MATCLGIYIDKNIIKYAKVSRDKASVKIEAFGVAIYSDIRQALKKVIEETYSYNVPISINLTDEVYNYIYMSNLLNNNDLKKAIKTEFDSYCYDKESNPNALETRYILVNDIDDTEKIKVIHVSIDKIKLNNMILNFDNQKVTTISPLPLDIANIAPLDNKTNVAIVNIEDTTTVTLITGEKVYDVKKIDIGAGKILDSINQKENSYQKSYEICKNSTIYTMEGKDLQNSDNDYLTYIIPNLYQIATQVNAIIEESTLKISKVYITGTGAVINNIDLYFEEILNNIKCEILKPFFLENNPKINIKDYIEVNSAIALALEGLGFGIQNVNFSKQKKSVFSNITIGKKQDAEEKNGMLGKLNSISISNEKIGRFTTYAMTLSLVLLLTYSTISIFIGSQLNSKGNELAAIEADTNNQIELANNDIKIVKAKTTEYNSLTKKLQDATNQISTKTSYKNIIPVFLSELTRIIPKEVKVTSLENTSDKKIVIKAESQKYEQLAYLKAKIKSEEILQPNSVVSTEAVKDGTAVKIVIEGELP